MLKHHKGKCALLLSLLAATATSQVAAEETVTPANTDEVAASSLLVKTPSTTETSETTDVSIELPPATGQIPDSDEESPMLAIAAPVQNVHSVDEVLSGSLSGQVVTVEGYITGSLAQSGKKYETVSTNLTLGAKLDATATNTVPVQLTKGDFRANYNLQDHPDFVGKKVYITGTVEKYFGRPGLKKLTAFEFADDRESTIEPEKPANPQPPTTPETPQTTPENTQSIDSVRQGEQNQTYTIAGKIISAVNGWGGHGFYLEDASGKGIYIYPKADLSYQTGDSIQLTGDLTNFRGELQLTKVRDHKKVANISVAAPDSLTSVLDLNQHQSTLVTLRDLTAGQLTADSFGTVSFTATDSQNNSVAIRVDNRTGIVAEDLMGKIKENSLFDLTAIVSTFDGKVQLKPFALEQFSNIRNDKVTENTSQPTESVLKIGQIQGAQHRSPYENQTVIVENAVVTYVDGASRFYIQDQEPDKDARTSDGVMVYLPQHGVKVGDLVRVEGRVEEFYGSGYPEKAKTDLTITQIKGNKVTVTGKADIPAPIVLGTDVQLPRGVVDNDGMTQFDPEEDALDFWESLEGMVVAIDNPKALGPQLHKEVYVVPGNYDGDLNKVGGLLLGANDANPEKIALLFKKALVVKSGDHFKGRITGPITYSYTNYKVLVNDTTATLVDGGLKPEVTTILPDADKLTIASYNIENFSADEKETPQSKVERIATSIVSDLHSPDIVTLIEVQDADGQADSGNTDATASAKRLIDAIIAQGGASYRYIDIAPHNNQDGGAPGGNIRTGFLYNPDRVNLANKPKGDADTAAQWNNGELIHSIARIAPTNPEWQSVRKPVVAEFEFRGEKIAVMAVHLNSKRGDNGLFGSVQPVTFHSETKRHKLADMIANFVAMGKLQNPRANLAILGDFNDYEFTETIKRLEKEHLFNLVSQHDEKDRFSYFYQGNNQSLDNILLSNNLKERYVFDMVHVNSPFMVEHGRASDHDPLLVQIDLKTLEYKVGTGVTLDKPDYDLGESAVGSGVTVDKPDYDLIETAVGTGVYVDQPTMTLTTDKPSKIKPSPAPQGQLQKPLTETERQDLHQMVKEAYQNSQAQTSPAVNQTLPKTNSKETSLISLIGLGLLGLVPFRRRKG